MTERRAEVRQWGADVLPSCLFGLVVAVAGPVLLFHYGAYHWFRGDEWVLLAGPNGSSFPDLFEPHTGSHLVALPRLLYYGLWQVFGATTYKPYQLIVVVTHVAIAVLLHAVMRRAKVRPWIAFAAVALFVLVGPGAKNAVWAFQMGFNGSLAWGLAHLLLADHGGRADRRDALGLVCGLLAIASSGVGISLAAGVGVAVLMRRGWRMALVHSAPLLTFYAVWAVIADAGTYGSSGRPGVEVLLDWTKSFAVGTFVGLGRFEVLAWAFVAVVLVGAVLLGMGHRGGDLPDLRITLAIPIGLALAALSFVLTTGLARSWLGASAARGDRYVYIAAALILPLIAVTAEAIASRWRAFGPVVVLLFLFAVPFNLNGFDQGRFDEQWMDKQQYVLTTAVRMPFANDVPSDVVPASDSGASDRVTIGFLLEAASHGSLTPSTIPLTSAVVDEFKVRLGVAQRSLPGLPSGCRIYDEPVLLNPRRGDVVYIGGRVSVAVLGDGQRSSRPVIFDPLIGGYELTIELPDLSLRIGPAGQAARFGLCAAAGE